MTQAYSRRSPEQWQQILNEQSQSGLSQERFCTDNAISYGTFQTWRKKLTSRQNSLQDFVEIPREPAADRQSLPLDQGLRVRIELGAGVVLELSRA